MNSAVNPFVHNRVPTPTEFLGREPELRRLFSRLANGQATAIIGQPKVGKTSLLKYVREARPWQESFGTYFDQDLFSFQDVPALRNIESPAEFWRRVLEPLTVCLQAGQPEPLQSLVDIYSLAQKNMFGTFELEQLFNKLHHVGSRLVLWLDHFDSILSHPILNNAGFYAELRSLASRSNGFVLVIITRQDLTHLHEKTKAINYGSPYFDVFTEIRLSSLSKTTMLKLLNRAENRFDQSDHDYVMTVSGGHPYLAQIAAAKLWDGHEEGLKGTARYITAGSELYHEVESHFAETWRFWTDEFRIAVTTVALIQIPRLLAQSSLVEIGLLDDLANYAPELAMLETAGVVTYEDSEGWRITQAAFLWWLIDELRRTIRGESNFKTWLEKRERGGRLTRQEHETVESAAKKVLAALDRGAMTLIEIFAKKFGEGVK